MADTSKNGVFFDTKSNKVVQSQPEEGIQLVAPGTEVTPADQARIDNYQAIADGKAGEPETVTTTTASGKKG